MVQLVDNEDDRLVEFFCITELVQRAHFHSVLGIEHHQSGVGHVHGRNAGADKIVRTGAVYEIELAILPWHAENRRENRITVFFFNREIVAYRILVFHAAPAFDDSAFIKKSFGERGFS